MNLKTSLPNINPPKKEIKKNNVILPKKLVPIIEKSVSIEPISQVTTEKKRKSTQQPGQTNKKKKGNRKEKGLRHFSLKVCEKVQNKGKTSYSEVANELVEEFIDKDLTSSEQKNEEKNIRRRVYDALNVLMALDIIIKDKKDILWKGFSRMDDENILHQKELLEMNKLRKKQQIDDLLKTEQDLKRVIDLNNSIEYQKSNPLSRIELPFILISTDKGSEIECEMNPLETRLNLNFNLPFQFNDNLDISAHKFSK